MKIDRAGNGYILTKENGLKDVHLTLESVFSYMLLYFEGRGKYFKDNSFGDVEIHRAPGETHKGGDVIMPVKVKAKKAVKKAVKKKTVKLVTIVKKVKAKPKAKPKGKK